MPDRPKPEVLDRRERAIAEVRALAEWCDRLIEAGAVTELQLAEIIIQGSALRREYCDIFVDDREIWPGAGGLVH